MHKYRLKKKDRIPPSTKIVKGASLNHLKKLSYIRCNFWWTGKVHKGHKVAAAIMQRRREKGDLPRWKDMAFIRKSEKAEGFQSAVP